MQCIICRKRLTPQLEHESEVVLQRMALGKGLHPGDLVRQLHPLCRLCRMIFQQVCETEPTGGELDSTRSAEYEQIAALLKNVRTIKLA